MEKTPVSKLSSEELLKEYRQAMTIGEWDEKRFDEVLRRIQLYVELTDLHKYYMLLINMGCTAEGDEALEVLQNTLLDQIRAGNGEAQKQ